VVSASGAGVFAVVAVCGLEAAPAAGVFAAGV